MQLGKDEIDFLVNHVILPPKLPQEYEGEDEERRGEFTLLRFVIEAIASLAEQCDGPIQEAWRFAKSALENLDKTSVGSTLSKESLEWALSTLERSEALALHVKAQNAGLLIHRNSNDQIIFDAFEASADSQSVIQTKGRMVWQFPGCSVIAPCEKIQDARFRTELAAEIYRLHSERVPQMQPTSRKANESVKESRDTSHPGLVTEKLMSSLTAYGNNFNGPKLCKHVRDEVNWNEAGIPWRRSPFWLVVRVCVNLVLAYSLDQETANRQYKNLIAYLIARISYAIQSEISPDVAAIINIKAARKLSKLGDNALDFVITAVRSAVTESQLQLNQSWHQIQAKDQRGIDTLPTKAAETDFHLHLTRSGPYILQAIANDCTTTEPTEFRPLQAPLLLFNSTGLPILDTISLEHRSFLLEDFEHWAFENLWTWKLGRPAWRNDCVSLAAVLTQYMNAAGLLYSGNSRATSTMLLAVLHIWTVLDSICIELQPMMKEYSPEVPQQILEPLLLPRRYHMEKLASIEEYLEKRHRAANQAKCRILGDPTYDSFSVRYFDSSPSLRDLRIKIESEAQERRDKKTNEWREKSRKHEALNHEAVPLSHRCRDEEGTFLRRKCRKCDLEREANALEIYIDEWPLPQNESQLKAAVFELDCPVEFAVWRDSTYAILQDLGRESLIRQRSPETTVSSYELLRRHFSNKGQVVTLGSTTKSFLKSHYRSYKFPRSLGDVCLPNALKYRLVHGGSHVWVGDQTSRPNFHRLCTTKLPQAQYSNLQAFVDTSSSAPNEAIARQSQCLAGLSDHEFIAFATLRAGERVQLLNILRELGSADLTFGAEAVHVLIRQATLQAGTSGQDVERVAHEAFKDVSFCNRLLGLLNDHLEAIKGNWKEQHRLTTLTLLGLRILSLTNDSVVVEQATKLLLSIRGVALRWCREVSSKLPSCSTEGSAINLRTAILRMALTCRVTFDVDPQNISRMLGSDEDVSNLVETSVLIQNNQPILLTDLPLEAQHDMLLNRKLSRKLEPHLRTLIGQSSRGVNQAIGLICAMSDFNGEWGSSLVSSSSWIVNETAQRAGARRQKIHLNLLDGQLLIDGQPLGRLPSEYIQKPLYRRVFGPRILNVSNSNLPQMRYRSLGLIEGHEVHLGLHGQELLIKAVTENRVLRIIPHETFDGDVPYPFKHDFVHWMDIENRSIEFRPVKTPWAQTSQAIKIEFNPEGRSVMQMSGNSKLIEQRSTLGRSICAILEPIEEKFNLVITSSPGGKIWTELPRFGLKFVVNEDGLLESQQLSSTVAQEQDIGCMYGLQNKLILEATGSHDSLNHKSVLVPHGMVSVSSTGGHRSVSIETDSTKKLRFFQFSLNTTLGTLQGGSNVTELLFKAYLHATTSFVLPDPLTGHTGTAEALSILQDKRLKTSFALNEDASEILLKIADLTPRRIHYPPHVEKMQQIQWLPMLDQLAQHEDFYTLALDIIVHNSQFSILAEPNDFTEDKISRRRGKTFLLDRASLRNSGIRHTRLERDLHQDRNHDRVYKSRDRDMKSPRALRVYEITSLILEWPNQVPVMKSLRRQAESSWSNVSGYRLDLEADKMTLTDTLELPIEENFGYLYTRCRDCTKEADTHNLVFLFATLDFGSVPDQVLRSSYLRTLLGIAFSRRFKDIMPQHRNYTLSRGTAVSSWTLESRLENVCRNFIGRQEETRTERRGRQETYQREKREQIQRLIESVTSHWPCDAPPMPRYRGFHILDINRAALVCSELFSEWNKNRQYLMHLNNVDEILRQIFTPSFDAKRPCETFVQGNPLSHQFEKIYPSLMDLIRSKAPPKLERQPQIFFTSSPDANCAKESSERIELRQILAELRSGGNETRTSYVDDLLSSVEALERTPTQEFPQEIEQQLHVLLDHREELSSFVHKCLGGFHDTLRPMAAPEEVVQIAGLWPRITPSALLKCLSPRMLNKLSVGWREALSAFGQAISLLQRSERLIGLKLKNNALDFYKEASEPGFQGWTAGEFPDWLLIEIENNLTIRAVQAVVAKQMISPSTSSNSVLQLSMGQGKSSVIIPMAVTALANRQQIARLIVLKPLLKQTHSLLTHRLGGLVDRGVYHTPFSRETKLSESGVSNLREIYLRCQEEQGVLLALPEHILSFRLMGRERLQLPKHEQLAKSLISLDTWLGEHCRDVLDESDELLDSKFQLVYSMGNQQHMDGQPDRWLLISGVFSLIMKSVRQMHSQYLADVQVDYRGRSFPFFSFLQPQACPRFIEAIANEVLKGNLIGVSFDHCSPAAHEAARRFICERDLTADNFSLVQREFDGPLLTKLHLLRGLFAHKILDFVLQHKLWLVNYGLALDRCLMAVPYRAKGVPSQRAEFGHPDVGLALTCLSYYYSGLTSSQLRHSFEILMAESDPDSEYARWIRDCSCLPPELSSLDGVNLEDVDLWESKIFPSLRFSKTLADFYMARVVFPREGKEFPNKLSLSAWDLPSDNKDMVTTGFSGTNDNKSLLPSSIHQHDLPQLQHTNAGVIDLLLQEDNRSYFESKNDQGRSLDLDGFLQAISKQQRQIQVLIDVGAQILEAGNEEVARKWLDLSPKCEAAVFFSEADEVMVVGRDSHVELLSTSPFKKKLDHCVVYLDEVHTRGVDLQFPTDFRAAVTLGTKLTKDRLVQGCMRMRKLGNNQSVAFFAPPQVHQDILSISGKTAAEQLDSADVVRWSLKQTCSITDAMKPLYIIQGLEFAHRSRKCFALADIGALTTSEISSFNQDIQEPEARTLEEMYGADASKNIIRPCLMDDLAWIDPVSQHLIAQWNASDPTANQDFVLQEEQEREISHEVEQEREIQNAAPAKAMPHVLYPEFVDFIKTGKLQKGMSMPIMPAFQGLTKTSAYKHLAVSSTSHKLYVTRDFVQTVRESNRSDYDQYIRPVKFVVSSTVTTELVIISPFEANELLPSFRNSTTTRLHIYSASTSKKMKSFSDLSFYTVTGIRPAEPPPLPLATAQLDIFAGCLFLRDYASYLGVCDFLGIVARKGRSDNDGNKKIRIATDGFADHPTRVAMNWPVASPFTTSPLPFLRALVGIRRKGQAYSQTHLGHVTNGRVLTEDSFQAV